MTRSPCTKYSKTVLYSKTRHAHLTGRFASAATHHFSSFEYHALASVAQLGIIYDAPLYCYSFLRFPWPCFRL